ncbi:hypothetical protein [Streptomyces sp. NPDC060022]|uniref:hypothetical protein n=1 Tax=Streptomyces sp. NPDC060022 TaxID=3347039 RepID=UPI0036959887
MSLRRKIAIGLAAVVAVIVFVPSGWAVLAVLLAAVCFGAYCAFLWWEDSSRRR